MNRITQLKSPTANRPGVDLPGARAGKRLGGAALANSAAAKLLYVLIVSACLYGLFSHWSYDDPYITYRYAHNLAQGQGFVYNLGERTLSTTTPFFTLLLAGLSFVWPDLPRLAVLIGAISIAVGALLLGELAGPSRQPWAAGLVLLLYPTFTILLTTLSSETPLYITLCLAALASYHRRRTGWAGFWAGLAFLTRPDGLLLGAVLALDFLFEVLARRKTWRELPWRAGLAFLGLALPWLAFAWAYFGSPLPVTLAAKQYQGTMLISEQFWPGFLRTVRNNSQFWVFWGEAALLVVGLVLAFRRGGPERLVLMWTALYFTGYTVLKVSRYFWYYAPLAPGFLLSVGLGLQGLARWFEARWPRPGWRFALGLVVIFTLGQGQLTWQLHTTQDPRLPVYREIGLWVKEHTPPEASLGTLEIGVVGFYAQRRMVDFAGLLYPPVARQLEGQADFQEAARWAMANLQVDYLLMAENSFPALADEISRRCHPVQIFSGKPYNVPVGNQVLYQCEMR